MTASAPRRSWSRCHSSTASPTRAAARMASISSQEPGNWTTPNFTRSRSPPRAGWPAAARTWRGSCAGSSTSSSTSRPTCTLRTPSNPSAGSARSTACPCGSRIPALGRIRTRALTPTALQPARERLAGELLVGGHVALARRGHDVVGDRRRRRGLVPARAGGPVAHVLLVERRLAVPDLVLVGGPEARRVGRADLVAEREHAGGVEPELELRVGQDHAARPGVLGDRLVDGDRDVAQPPGELVGAHELRGPGQVDRLVVALLGLRRRREDRLRQLLGLLQAGGQLDAGDRARALVVLPARARDVAAHDALDRQHLQPLDPQRAPALVGRHAVGGGEEVVGHDLLRQPEPQDGEARQDLALVRDRRRMDDVVGRDPVGGDHQQVAVQVVDLADLALGQQRERHASNLATGQAAGMTSSRPSSSGTKRT